MCSRGKKTRRWLWDISSSYDCMPKKVESKTIISTVSVEQRQELFSCLCTWSHATKHATGSSCACCFLYASHDHAEMTWLHDHSNALRFQNFCNGESDLFGQSFLYLKTTGEHLSESCKFREANDSAVGDVANVHLIYVSRCDLLSLFWKIKEKIDVVQYIATYLPNEWHQMMLAERVDLDILHNNQLIMILVENSTVHHITNILFIPLCQKH